RRSDRLERGDVGAVDALPSVGGHRHPEKDLVDRPRSEPVRDGAAALWLQGADRRLQAAPAPEELSGNDAVAPRGLRARVSALGRARIFRAAAKADDVSSGLTVSSA